MKHTFLVVAALVQVVALVVITATAAVAQCSFERPLAARKYSTALVAAFPESTSPNTSTVDNVMAYEPSLTFGETSVAPPSQSWRWIPFKTDGSVTIDTMSNPPRLKIHLNLSDVVDGNFGKANGPGKLRITIRATKNDPVGTDVTAVDFPAEFPLTAANGNIRFEKPPTLATTITPAALPGPVPLQSLAIVSCASLEIRAVEVVDSAGEVFAVGGVYVPNINVTYQPTLGGPQCEYQHPKAAKNMYLPLVQAFNPCTGPTITTGNFLDACPLPSTVNNAATGWSWGPLKSTGWVEFKLKKNYGGTNGKGGDDEDNPDNTGDVLITAALSGIVIGPGPARATETGSLKMRWRFTFADRARGDMTMIDFPLTTAFALSDGHGTVSTSVNSILNTIPGLPFFGMQDLPGCTTAELVSVEIADGNGETFAVPGLRTQ